MTDLSLHLAPNAPWLLLLLASAAFAALAVWAYRFSLPPLPARARRGLPLLRLLGLLGLLWLLAQPVLERAAGGGARVVILLDRSRSMDLPAGAGGESRAAEAEDLVRDLRRAWRGRAAVEVMSFAARLDADTARAGGRGATALGDALESLARSPSGQRASAVVVVSDGATNAGVDPLATARSLGVPLHAVVVGEARGADRAVAGVEASVSARVGEATPVRVRVVTTEERGTAVGVRLIEEGRELGRATAIAPGSGAEATVEFRVTPVRPGLAVWAAVVDSLAGEVTTANNARQAAVEVAPGRLGVLVVSGGLNWDLAFLRRALLGDSSVSLDTRVRERDGWRALERGARAAAPGADLKGRAVVVLDAISPAEVGPGFDEALASFVRGGGGLLAFGGRAPGLGRYRAGRLGSDLAFALAPGAEARDANPMPTPQGEELLAWDDDPARGVRAWRVAAPLEDCAPLVAGAGDRVLLGSLGGPPLLVARHVGRGQALLVNGTGTWRWSLSSNDELAAERGRRLWRRVVRWLAEPVQGEPLRVKPERWLSAGGEPVRLFATLQDAEFQPVAGAAVEADLEGDGGQARSVRFAPRAAGSYVAELEELPPGRYRLSARATRGRAELGRARTEFAVDRWSLEELRTQPDSASLAALAVATGGRVTGAREAAGWARRLEARALARGRTASARLWESPWVFLLVVGLLSLEWAWRRRRGLP